MASGVYKSGYRAGYRDQGYTSGYPGEGEAALAISPAAPSLASGATQVFTASGGTGPYTFAISTNASGAAIVDHGDGTATYTAGYVLAGVTDVVTVTDSVAATANANVAVAVIAMRAWYDAAKGITLSGSDVTVWADQSGNGFDLTPPGGLDVPTLHTGIVNGLPGVLFDTTNGNAQLNNPFTGGIANNAARYVVAVIKPTAPTVGPQAAGFSWGGPVGLINNAVYGLFYPVLGDYSGNLYVSGNSTVFPDPTTAGTAYAYEWGSSGFPGALSLYLNGSALTPSDSASYTDGSPGLVIGSDNGSGNASFCGYVCELMIFDHVPGGPELAAVRAYLNTKWGV